MHNSQYGIKHFLYVLWQTARRARAHQGWLLVVLRRTTFTV